jgi:hypothetical protein
MKRLLSKLLMLCLVAQSMTGIAFATVDVSSLEVSLSASTPDYGVVEPGTEDVEFVKYDFTANSDVVLKSFTLHLVGNIGDIGEFTLLDDSGSVLSTTELITSGTDAMLFTFQLNDYPILTGTTKVLTVAVDIKADAILNHADHIRIVDADAIDAEDSESGEDATVSGDFPIMMKGGFTVGGNNTGTATTGAPVDFEVSVNDYPNHNDPSKIANLPNSYINVYSVNPVAAGQYEGVLKETLFTGTQAYATTTVEYEEMVAFVGFKYVENASAHPTWNFFYPPYKNFGEEDQLCQIKYLDTTKPLSSFDDCANSHSTPYQDGDDGTATAPDEEDTDTGIAGRRTTPTCSGASSDDLYRQETLQVYTPAYGNQTVKEYCVDRDGTRNPNGKYVEELICLSGDPQFAYKHDRTFCKYGCHEGACIQVTPLDNADPDLVQPVSRFIPEPTPRPEPILISEPRPEPIEEPAECADCDIAVRKARDAGEKMNEALREVHAAKVHVSRLYSKLYSFREALADFIPKFKVALEEAGGTLGGACRNEVMANEETGAVESSNDVSTTAELERNVEGVPYVIAGIKFCLPNTDAGVDLVDRLEDVVSDDKEGFKIVLGEIRNAHVALKKALTNLHSKVKTHKVLTKKAKDCLKEIKDACFTRRPKVRPDIRPPHYIPDGKPFVITVQWGYVTQKGGDTSQKRWEGDMSIDTGKVFATKELLFEQNDNLHEQTDESIVSFDALTTTHWDGLMLKFVPERGVMNNFATINVEGFGQRYSMTDLANINERILTGDGREIVIKSVHRPTGLPEIKMEKLVDMKERLMKKFTDIQEKVKRLIDSGNMTDEMIDRLSELLDKLLNYNFTEGVEGDVMAELGLLMAEMHDDGPVPNLGARLNAFDENLGRIKRQVMPEKFRQGLIPFEDVDDDQWYFDSVRFLKDNGIVSGYAGSNDFGPGNSVTRAEVVKMVLEAAGSELSEEDLAVFQDMAEHWAKKYVRYAYKNGIIKGYNDGFRPNQFVTRAEALKIVMGALGITVPECSRSEFTDMDGHWAMCVVQEAKDLGIVAGMPDGNFHPDKPITRAAFAQLLRQAVEVLQQDDYEGVDQDLVELYLQ